MADQENPPPAERLEDRIVNAIIKDLTGRRGLRQEWEQIDEDIQDEIRETWKQIVADGLVQRHAVSIEQALQLAIEVVRHGERLPHPQPGDLVVEVSKTGPDPDAIGWLAAHGDAPYNEGDPTDGSAPMREVWDVLPLRGGESQRWENAEFMKVPDRVLDRTGLAILRPPRD